MGGLFDSEPFAQLPGQTALDTDAALDAERCKRCGYRSDEHRFDGACPTSDDDAAYYHEHDH